MTVEKPPAEEAIVVRQVTVGLIEKPIVVQASGELAFTRGSRSNPALAHMLIFDEAVGAYRVVLTPPGTSWELVQKQQGPSLWKPGMPT